MTERRCSNWLGSFMKWSVPRSEAKESYILYTGIFCLAAALRRQVKISKDYLGGWSCYPSMYILFVAPPGAARKTTTMKFASTLLERVQDLYQGSAITTQAALMNEMVEGSMDGSVYLTVGEFSDLVMKSKSDMYEFLTSAFDGANFIKAKTIGRGEEIVENPCINLLAATTPKWLGANLTEEQIGAGFSSRVLFLFEESARRKKLWYDDEIDQKKYEEMEDDLVHDLIKIASLKGEFKITDEAKKMTASWYHKHDPTKETVYVRGFSERKVTHLLKMAMIVHVSRSDSLVIDVEDFEQAMKYLNIVEKKLPLVFASMGKNIYKLDMEEVLRALKNIKGGMTSKQMYRSLMSSGTETQIIELISTMISAGWIIYKDERYTITKDGLKHLAEYEEGAS